MVYGWSTSPPDGYPKAIHRRPRSYPEATQSQLVGHPPTVLLVMRSWPGSRRLRGAGLRGRIGSGLGVETVTVMEAQQFAHAGSCMSASAGSSLARRSQALSGSLGRRAAPRSHHPALDLIELRIEPRPQRRWRRLASLRGMPAAPAAEDDLVEQQGHDRRQRPQDVLAQMGLAPAELGELEHKPRPQSDRACIIEAPSASACTQEAGVVSKSCQVRSVSFHTRHQAWASRWRTTYLLPEASCTA